MLDQDKVMQYFATYSGLDSEMLTHWQCLCTSAASYIARRLRADVDSEAEMDTLCAAAAAVALADYLALQNGSGSADELRVGDITLSSSSQASGNMGAEGILDHFLARAAHLLEPEYPALFAADTTDEEGTTV